MSGKAKSIFSGVPLTQHTPLARTGPDQRLFAPSPAAAPEPTPQEPAPSPPAAESKNLETKEARNLGSKEPSKGAPSRPRNLGSKEPRLPATAPTTPADQTPRFDFEVRPGRQANFVFTDDELDAVEDLKRDARRKYGLTTTKQDIVRFAVIDLLADFEARGEASRFMRWLAQRKHRS